MDQGQAEAVNKLLAQGADARAEVSGWTMLGRAEKLPQTAAWTANAVATPMRARRSLSGTRAR